MALSGSYDFTETTDQISTDALIGIGKLKIGGTASAAQLAECRNRLNKIVKALQNKNVFLWSVELQIHYITTCSEVLGTDSANYKCILGHTSTANTRPVTGLEWPMYWVESGASGLNHAIGSSYTSAGDFLTSNIIAIEQAAIRINGEDEPLEILTKDQWFKIEDKKEFGTPKYIFFDPKLSPRAYLSPIPTDVNEVINYKGVKLLQDLDSGSNNLDFPVSWLQTLTQMLMYDLCGPYQVDNQTRMIIKSDMKEALKEAMGGNRETSDNNFIVPAWGI